MSFQVHDWHHMTGAAIDAIPREHAVVLVTGSPIEVHGPHLPTITDIAEADGLAIEVARRMWERHPEMVFLRLPAIYVSADVLPHVGSLKFRQSTIQRVYEDLGRTLCAQGFKNIWVGGFHGGPRHFTPIEAAAVKVNRRYGGRMISVFSLLMTWLTGGRTDLSDLLGQVDGIDASDLHGDAHGGAVETSMMLALLGEHVDPVWRDTGSSTVTEWLASRGEPPLAFSDPPRLRELFRSFQAKIKFYEERTWSGTPRIASAELGEAFIELLAEQGAAALDEVWTGKRPLSDCHAPTWKTRWIFQWEWLSALFERAVDYRNRVW